MPLAPTPTARTPRSHRGRAAAATRVAALAGVVALVVVGCVAPKEQTKPREGDAPSAEAAEGMDLEAFYAQEIAWEACDDFECGTVLAPLDWDDPEAGSIELAVKRSLATGTADQRIGSLLINPGGPGVSAAEFVSYAVSDVISEPVLDAYDVVGFDPRGVGGSTAVDCGPADVVDAYLTQDVVLESQADVEAARQEVQEFGQGCLDATGPLLGEVDTVSSARDLDLLRGVLGDDELYYAGFSYGTFLGATYAELFPDKVGRLLLDGALDPSMSQDDLLVGQAVGFEKSLRAYVADCQAGADCPLTGGVDGGMQQIADLVARAEAKPLEAPNGNLVNGTLAFYGVIAALYDDASWPYLTEALRGAIQQNSGEVLLLLANFYLDRTEDGQYTSNAMIAFSAINCLDYPTEVRDYDEMVAFADEIRAKAPTFGAEFAMAVGCETWPFQSTAERGPITAAGAAPILVVGTTGDPATPYEWSVALADQLESGQLLTWEGEGHTAYGRSNDCLQGAVDTYLLEGTLPEEGLVC